MGDTGEKSLDSEAEGVWSPDIEASFQAALTIYPPCGRRKIILADQKKMYGRNELISRYIQLKTGKTRTRKQVSSHIQVLARRKIRDFQAKLRDQEENELQELQNMTAMSSGQFIPDTFFHEIPYLPEANYPSSSTTQSGDFFQFWDENVNQDQITPDIKAILQAPYSITPNAASLAAPGFPIIPGRGSCQSSTTASWPRSHIGTETLRLAEFTAFMEWQTGRNTYNRQHCFVHIGPTPTCEPPLEMVDIRQIYDKFPEEEGGLRDLYNQGPPHAFFLVKFWADLSYSILGEELRGIGGAFYGVSSRYEGPRALTLSCTSTVCSFGKVVVEKLETAELPYWENDRFVFCIQRSPFCDYLINFIRKLRRLPEKQMMDSVLENFSVLQVLRDQATNELLLCVAHVFAVSSRERGPQHHIYQLGLE